MKKFLHWISIGMLILFSGMVAFVFLCAMFLPSRSESPHPFGKEGFHLEGASVQSVRFSSEGSELFFDHVEQYGHPHTGETRERRESRMVKVSLPPVETPSLRDLRREEWFLGKLLSLGGALPGECEVAFSPVGGGMVFSTREEIFLKVKSGEWSCLHGQGLPRDLRRLNESRGALSERLSHPDLLVWTDAAVERILKEGVEASLFSDALLRSYRVRQELRDPLLDLLFETGNPRELVRTVLNISEDGLFRQAILDRWEGSGSLRDRARVLTWMTMSDWVGFEIGPYLKDYLVRCLEDSIFDLLSSEDQREPFERMIRFLDKTHWERLGRIVESGRGVSVSAAWFVLCHLSGNPREGFPRREQGDIAKKWWARKRSGKQE